MVFTAQKQTQAVGGNGTHYYTLPFSYPPGYTDIIPAKGDWLDILSLNNANYASCLYVALNNGQPFPVSYLPVRSPFYMLRVYNGCTATVSGTFIIGRELFQPAKISVSLPSVMSVNVQSPLDSNGNLKADIYYPLDSNNNVKVGIYSPLDGLGYVKTDIMVKNGSSPYWSTTLVNNQTITSNGSTSNIQVNNYLHFFVFIYVTAVSGTSPSLNVYLNAVDEVNNYQSIPIASVTNITSTGTYYMSATNLPVAWINVSWTVGGTSPSFTVTITLHMKW